MNNKLTDKGETMEITRSGAICELAHSNTSFPSILAYLWLICEIFRRLGCHGYQLREPNCQKTAYLKPATKRSVSREKRVQYSLSDARSAKSNLFHASSVIVID